VATEAVDLDDQRTWPSGVATEYAKRIGAAAGG